MALLVLRLAVPEELPLPALPEAAVPEAAVPARLAFWAALFYFRFHSPIAMFSFWLVTSLLNFC